MSQKKNENPNHTVLLFSLNTLAKPQKFEKGLMMLRGTRRLPSLIPSPLGQFVCQTEDRYTLAQQPPLQEYGPRTCLHAREQATEDTRMSLHQNWPRLLENSKPVHKWSKMQV